MKLGRCLPDEAFQQSSGCSAGAELVHVVEDEHLIALSFFLERLVGPAASGCSHGVLGLPGERLVLDVELEASARPRANEVTERSPPSTRYQCQPRSVATDAASVDLPKPSQPRST